MVENRNSRWFFAPNFRKFKNWWPCDWRYYKFAINPTLLNTLMQPKLKHIFNVHPWKIFHWLILQIFDLQNQTSTLPPAILPYLARVVPVATPAKYLHPWLIFDWSIIYDSEPQLDGIILFVVHCRCESHSLYTIV